MGNFAAVSAEATGVNDLISQNVNRVNDLFFSKLSLGILLKKSPDIAQSERGVCLHYLIFREGNLFTLTHLEKVAPWTLGDLVLSLVSQ